MSARDLIETEMTITVDGDEVDVPVRCYVQYGIGLGVGSSWGAALDSDPEALIAGEWVTLTASHEDYERIDDLLCDLRIKAEEAAAEEAAE